MERVKQYNKPPIVDACSYQIILAMATHCGDIPWINA
jgi:hypothetical protein